MGATGGRWVVYEKRGIEYVHISKWFKTKREAEKERERLQQALNSKRKVPRTEVKANPLGTMQYKEFVRWRTWKRLAFVISWRRVNPKYACPHQIKMRCLYAGKSLSSRRFRTNAESD